MKNTIALFLSILFCISLNAQEDKLFSIRKIKKDFKHLVEAIEAHPSPYRHISKEDMDKLIDSTRNSIVEPMTVLDFYKMAAPIYSRIKDGHTSVSISYEWFKEHEEKYGIFPCKIHISNENKMYVLASYGDNRTIPTGTEIVSLNGVPAAVFIEAISPYVSYEQEVFRNRVIENRINFYLLLYFGEISKINLRGMKDGESDYLIKYMTYSQWEEKEIKKDWGDKPYSYKKIKEGVGLLKIHSFAIKNQGKYEVFLRKMFRRIKEENVQSLIIDIRGNFGGHPKSVSDLMHYISRKYFKTMARSEMKVSEVYRRYFQNKAPSANFYHSSYQLHYVDIYSIFAKADGDLSVEEALYNEPPKKVKNEFNGDLYLLTDSRSYSAASSFAATFRCYQMGLIIGSETGGTSVFYANSMHKKLIHTDVVCSVATTCFYTTCFNEADEGIKPDIEVTPTVRNLADENDMPLNYTVMVINKVAKMREDEK